MGLMVLWMVVLYLRPSEALGIQRGDIQMPVKSIGKHAHVILFPEERPDRSKTYTANDSIELHCPWLCWFPTTVDVLREGPQEERIFPFTYSFSLTKWRAALKRCQLRMVPYDARHSGPSIDAAGLHRTRSEIQLRGRWAAESSVHRYEQKARLAQSFNKLSPHLQSHVLACERLIEDMLIKGGAPELLTSPSTRGP